ncbi:transmembrane protein 258 [Arapaima gigas]
MELEAMTRYTSPVNPAVFPHLTVVLLAIGMFFTAWFFVYESCSSPWWPHSSWGLVCSSCCFGSASTFEGASGGDGAQAHFIGEIAHGFHCGS